MSAEPTADPPVAPPAAPPSVWAARLDVLMAAALFSTAGAFVKSCALSPPQIAGLRSLVAGLFLLLIWPAARRRWTIGSLLFATLYAATMLSYVTAMKWTTAANAIFLQSTAPLWVLLLSPLVLKEKVRRGDIVFMAALGGGLALCFLDASEAATAPHPEKGNLVALCSGVLWGATIVALRWLGRRAKGGDDGAPASVVAGNLVTFAACWLLASRFGEEFWPAASFRHDPAFGPTVRSLLFLGVLQVGLAYVVLTRGLRGVTAVEASLLLLVEPVFNPIWAWLVHDERPGRYTLAGGCVILVATAYHALANPRAAPAADHPA